MWRWLLHDLVKIWLLDDSIEFFIYTVKLGHLHTFYMLKLGYEKSKILRNIKPSRNKIHMWAVTKARAFQLSGTAMVK